MSETNHKSEPQVREEIVGIMAEYDSADALMAAAEKVRDAGFSKWDTYTPYPVHGIDDAMGIRMTILPWLALGAGITGGSLGLLMQWWMNAVSYPFFISGKPLFSLPANIPVTFEMTILFAAFTTFLGMLALNRLPRWSNPLFKSERFRRVTADRFFLAIEAGDAKFNEAQIRDLLGGTEPTALETVWASASGQRLPLGLMIIGLVLVLLAFVPPAVAMSYRASIKTEPRIHLVHDMDFQPKFKAQAENVMFADGRAMRKPVPGTVARGGLQTNALLFRGVVDDQWTEEFPPEVPLSPETMDRGQVMYNIHCSACHGVAGFGDGMVARRAVETRQAKWVPPSSLHTEAVRRQPVGQLFHSITNGVRNMPPYGPQISVEDRWAILLYVRALQRSQNGTLEDVPENERAGLALQQ